MPSHERALAQEKNSDSARLSETKGKIAKESSGAEKHFAFMNQSD